MAAATDTIRILLVDDHTLLREAVRDVLLTEDDFTVVGEAGDGATAVGLAATTKPHVVLLDVEMPRSKPLETVERLLQVAPKARVIVLSMYDDPQLVREMLGLGIAGYLHKSIGQRDLINAIRSAGTGEGQVTVSVSREALALSGANAEVSGPLSSREIEVLALVSEAMSNRQIAGKLSITEGTVKRHLRNIFAKLGAMSRIDAVNKAVDLALIRKRY
ncbi:response regulator [Actinoalloteichus hymeniacidonis]|uniref:Two component LuxR family transcriptional regulator n=1 Tax=Actinoalloteichus hymeniacidonis TaxID=340345 RepID=A0AAC9MZN2_9PSEU|nr:response regulator transcription factor [Actinoalloteichus hymeniacidonis]AOS65593.1 two component LuxR family transcriptional regulator [Actinoalloteichus hymeniacidonis]MBB5906317.1 DNA-binding NarL/FixJ family response regulator [Actinoalloteichus hymeniacidonis]